MSTRSISATCVLSANLLLAFTSRLSADVIFVQESSTSDTTYDGSATPLDLVNSGQPSLASATTTRTPAFGFPGLNNGVAGTNTTDSAFYRNTELSSSVTFTLNTTVFAGGFDIQTIRSLAGWVGANQTQANQKYELLTSQVGSPSFTSHGLFEASPFTAASTAGSSTRITLTDTTGALATNVDAVRFNLFFPGFLGNNSNPGTVYRELDVEGAISLSPPPAAPVNLIQNGSFETPILGAGANQRYDTANPFDANWTISPVGASPDGEVTLVRGSFGTIASDGAQWLSLESFGGNQSPNNVGTIIQPFTTDANGVYELSFDYNALGADGVTSPWELTYDYGEGPTTLLIENPAQLTLGAWLHESVQFQGTGGPATLSFTGDSKVNGFFGTAIDNISIVQVDTLSGNDPGDGAVPEPASLLAWLICVAVAFCGFRLLRPKKRESAQPTAQNP